MRLWNTLLRISSLLPQRIRLALIAGCFIVCGILQLLALIFVHNFAFSSVFIIPTAMAAWMFKWRGASLGIGVSVLFFIIINTLFSKNILWPLPLAMSFLVGSLALVIVTLCISAARYGLDLVHTAHLKLEKAQEQMVLAYERQHQLDQLKDQFLLNISHELRTPLTVVSGYIDILREQHGHLDDGTLKEMLDSAFWGCNELHNLLSKVLEVAHIDHELSVPYMEEIVLAELLHSVLEVLGSHNLRDCKISLQEVPRDLIVHADRQILHQIVRNLLSNAFKYSQPHTPIHLIAYREPDTLASNAARSIILCIQDAGPGIPPEQISLLFHKFVRLKRDLSGPISGTGLGLYICKQLVEKMGGSTWVESSGIAGEGSRFYVALPSSAPSANNSLPLAVLSTSQKGRK